MKKLVLIAGLLGSFFCGSYVHAAVNELLHRQSNKGFNDTLIYRYHTAKERAPDCGTRPDSDCTVAKVRFPVFKAQAVLNDTIQRKLSSTFNLGSKKISTIKQLLHGVIKAYMADTELIRDKGFYLLRASLTVTRQNQSLLVCEIDGHTYAGGAHGLDQTIFLNWDIKKQKQVTLNDILVSGYGEQLRKTGEKIFRTDEKLSENATLADNYSFEKGKFTLNDNFMITPTGLKFLYNEYEIKSFAAGQTTLFIPFAQIKSLLRPKTVVSQYLK